MALVGNLRAAQFTEVTAAQGINIPNVSGTRFEGIAWGDSNGDGYLDLFIGGDGYAVTTRSASLYINQGPPDYRFVDYGTSAGLGALKGCLSAAWVDFDADGDQDLLVSRACQRDMSGTYYGGSLALYRNDGNNPPHFVDCASTFGIQAAEGLEVRFDLTDINHDGLLDLMVGRGGNNFNQPEKRLSYFYLSTHLRLYPYAIVQGLLNTQLRIAAPRWVRAVSFCDFDADGDQDLFLAGADGQAQNDTGLFVYDPNVGFFPHPDFAQAAPAGLAAWSDFDNDGDFDLFTIAYNANKLYVNQGPPDFRFQENHAALGVNFPPPPAASFEPKWADFNNDGYEDLFVCGLYTPSQLFLNQGGTHFVDVASTAGLSFDNSARMVAWGDFDNDGDMDLVMTGIFPPYIRLMRNNQNDNHYLKIVPVDENGRVENQFSAVVKLYAADQGSGSRTFVAMRKLGCTDGGYSQSQYLAHFGVDPTKRYYVRVIFSNGTVRDWDTNPQLGNISPAVANGSCLMIDTRGSVFIPTPGRGGVRFSRLYR